MPTKRFGARYGRKTRKKLANIESTQRGNHKCPKCNKLSVKRVAMGIWHCLKCENKFASKAYAA
jgi:large subunit ribosomal protein L37Ae